MHAQWFKHESSYIAKANVSHAPASALVSLFDYYTEVAFSNLESEAWKVGNQMDIFHIQRLAFKKRALQKEGVEEKGEALRGERDQRETEGRRGEEPGRKGGCGAKQDWCYKNYSPLAQAIAARIQVMTLQF